MKLPSPSARTSVSARAYAWPSLEALERDPDARCGARARFLGALLEAIRTRAGGCRGMIPLRRPRPRNPGLRPGRPVSQVRQVRARPRASARVSQRQPTSCRSATALLVRRNSQTATLRWTAARRIVLRAGAVSRTVIESAVIDLATAPARRAGDRAVRGAAGANASGRPILTTVPDAVAVPARHPRKCSSCCWAISGNRAPTGPRAGGR